MRSFGYRFCLLVVCLSAACGAALAGVKGGPRTVELRGTLEVLQEDDFASGTTQRIHLLHETATGRTWHVRFDREPEIPLFTGDTATIRGQVVDATTIETQDSGITIGPRTRAAVAGAHHALIMIADFQDEAVGCSDSTVGSKMFTGSSSVDGLYQDTSFGAVSFPGDTDGDGFPDVVRVSIAATTGAGCDYNTWAAAADAAAQSAGFDLGLYRHRVYVLPNGASCSWAGLGSVGCGSWCRSWTRYCDLQDVYAHELGHNLTMRHASTDADNDGTIDCEYCDASDFMGYGGVGWRQTNGPHKLQMGWIPPGQVVDVTAVAPQIHVLSPLEVDPTTAPYPQLLRLPAPTGESYFLSYRRKIGYDATLGNAYAERTAVHVSQADGSGNSRLVLSLVDGGQFADGTGLQVTQVSHDATSVTLLVEDTSLVCSDADGDGYGAPGSPVCPAGAATDCDDGDPARNPGAVEACNGTDDNCDGRIDEASMGTLPDGSMFAAVCHQFQRRSRPREGAASRTGLR